MFTQINEIVFYGKGGYDFDTVYNLPIWLRNFIYHEMVESYSREAETAEGKSKSTRAEKPQVNEVVMKELRKQSNFSIQKPR